MKKVLSVVLAVMMLASLSVCAFADVVPSIETKAAPAVEESSVETEGVAETAKITVEVTAVATEPDENATEEEKAEFEEKKEAVNQAIETVTEQATLVAAVENAVTVETTGTIAADVYDTSEDAEPIASDVFYVAAYDEEGNQILATEYEEGVAPTIKVRVKIELPKNLIKVLQLVGDTWIEVPVVLNDEGEPVLEFSYAGPVVFVVNANVEVG